MKTLVVTMATLLAAVSTFAQGMLNFSNYGPGLQARVFGCDGLTPLPGPLWVADLYWAEGTVTDSYLLVPLNAPAPFSTNAARAGYFFGGSRTIPSMPAGSIITAQVRVWNSAAGTNWAGALSAGGLVCESILFQVTLADPPGVPTTMTGLNGHSWWLEVIGIPGMYFLSPSRLSDGTFQVSIVSECPLTVLGSTNLSSWDPVESMGRDGYASGPITLFTDYAATNSPQRFYRLQLR